MYEQPSPPDLTTGQRAILDAEWPKFSEAEMVRRRHAMEALMADHDVTHLLLYGAGGRFRG